MDNRESVYKELLKQLVRTTQKSNGDIHKVSCEFCSTYITCASFIQCAICTSFFICIPCYCKGLSKSEHSHLHPYKLIESNNFSLFTPTWSANEELLLLENLLKYRIGNWSSISEAMSSSKSSKDCELHFKQIYFNKTVPDLQSYEILSFKDEKGSIQQKKLTNFEKFNKVIQNDDISLNCDKRIESEKGVLSDFSGFMPLRKDFDIEFENDFENCLADLEFFDDDRPSDVTAKLKLLDAYQLVLNEREERKSFVMERWPQEIKLEKKLKNTIFEKNAYFCLKPAARYLPYDKHSSFCEALSKEYLTKMRLDELKEARMKGIKTEEDFKRYLNIKKNNFHMKSKEYEILIKEPFAYKEGEALKLEILGKLEGMLGNFEDFCKRAGLTESQMEGLMDKIMGNLESKVGVHGDEIIEDNGKRELIDFIVKLRGN